MNEMILRESKEPVIREYAMDVQGAAKSLLSIINDILDITKIEAGKLTIIPVEYGFSSMIHDVVSMISFKAKAKELENTACILFRVKDTGIGIKEEDIPKLYVAFERIEEKRNRNIEGTGLGMNITMELLALLNSKLEVTSEYGKGSEFSFVLSQEIRNPEPIGKLGEQIEADNKEHDYQISYEAPEAKVLVVDDNEMNRRVFCSLLKDTKIQIEEAASGRTCLEKVKTTAFDIIFMDHMMTEMDGIETFRIMKKMENYPSKEAPVVILTANAIVGAKERYLKEGFEAFLSKPIDSQKLENLIEELLDENLLHYVKSTGSKLVDKVSYDISELPVIEGLDWTYAALHFKDMDSMIKSIQLFAATIEYEAEELEKLCDAIDTEEGQKNYCTKVHGMKNTASTVGIIPLAGMAKVLEDGARNNEWNMLIQMTPIFIKYWCEYKEKLNIFYDETDGTKPATEFQEEINVILEKIREAAEDMDVDTLDELSKELENYRFEGEQKEVFEQIKRAIINLDVEFLKKVYKI